MKKIFILFFALCSIAAMGQRKPADPKTSKMPAPLCDCGYWSNLSLQTVNGTNTYKCGSTINWNCKVPFEFSTYYHCNPVDKTCMTNVIWAVVMPDNTTISGSSGNGNNSLSSFFTPTQNGTYQLILNATCDGKKCSSCVYTIVVKDCITGCGCGNWGQLVVNGEKYNCGNEVNWKCNQQINFTNNYHCAPGDKSCPVNTNWEITKDGSPVISATGTQTISGSFTPTGNGAYKLTFGAECYGMKCQPCVFVFYVNDCLPTCDCGKWGELTVKTEEAITTYNCGSTINWNCNRLFNFSTYYHCDPLDKTCKTNIIWTVEKPDYTTISGSTGSVGNSLSASFLPTENGTYKLVLTATCDGKKCKSCVYTIVVGDCAGNECLSVLRDEAIYLGPDGQHKKYKFTLKLNNLTGQFCNMLQIMPQIVNSGNVLNVSSSSLPTGTTVVTGELTDFAPSDNPFCLKIICTRGTKKCEIIYCLKLP